MSPQLPQWTAERWVIVVLDIWPSSPDLTLHEITFWGDLLRTPFVSSSKDALTIVLNPVTRNMLYNDWKELPYSADVYLDVTLNICSDLEVW